MQISRIGFNGPAVVVLGAGATRGASFVESGREGRVLPPLDSDFFTQAQRLSREKPADLIAKLVENAVSIFGNDFRLTMEGYLTRLEQLANVYDDYKLQGRPRANKYRQMRDQFLQVLAAVLDQAIGPSAQCDHHKELVASLSAEDTILSFNYDWLIDLTLKRCANGSWNPRVGYGVPAKRGKATAFWAHKDKDGKALFPSNSIALLKMHGSMNWFPARANGDQPVRLHLRERWWHQHGNLAFEIAPPEWNKPIRSGIYKPIWRKARKALRDVSALVFIGYSLPETDLPAQALFMVDSDKDAPPLKLLATVNPDQAARQRVRQTLLKRMDSKTRVLSFDHFHDFADFLSS